MCKAPFHFLLFCALFNVAVARQSAAVIFEDRFTGYRDGADGSPRWHPVKGLWEVIGQSYLQRSPDYDCASLLDVYLNESFELSATFEHLEGELGVGFVFSARDQRNISLAQMIRFDGETTFILGYFQNGEYYGTASVKTAVVPPRTSHTLTLDVDRDGNRYTVRLDGDIIAAGLPLLYPAGYVGIQTGGGTARFLSVKLTRVPMKSQPLSINWLRHFALTPSHEIVVPDEHDGSIKILSKAGNILRTVGIPAASRGQLHTPNAVALLGDTIVVTDRGSDRLSLFKRSGEWISSVGWKGSDRGQFDGPAAVCTNERRQIFVVEEQNHRVQVFDDSLHYVSDFGSDKLAAPLDIAVEGDNVYVLNTGLSQVECFSWSGRKAGWRKSLSYGGGEARGLAVLNGRLYISVANEVRSYDSTGTLKNSMRGRSVNFIFPQGVTTDPSGHVYIADFFGGRIIRTSSDLLDPKPEISATDASTAVVSWQSIDDAEGSISIAASGTSGSSRLDERKKTTDHQIVLRNFTPSTTRHFNFEPGLSTIPDARGHQPAYALTTPAGNQTKLYARLPMIALIFTNVVDDQHPAASSPPQPDLPESEVERIQHQLDEAVRFYWIHSGMRLFLDLQRIVIRDRFKRSELYGNEWWYPPRDSVLERELSLQGRKISDFSGLLYLTCTQSYDTTLRKYVLAGKGGAFTNGVGTGKGYGISWWDVTRAHHDAGNNWLTVHEFNHQLDDIFLASGYPEYWFNHISPTIGTAAEFGEHFDANRFIIRMVPPGEWYDLRYTSLASARDADTDGIPDNDAALPLDEVRLGSDTTSTDTDRDGVSDLDELGFSNWIKEGWGEDPSPQLSSPNLHEGDADHDGIPDNRDEYPCSPIHSQVAYGDDSKIVGLQSPEMNAALSAGWNADSLVLNIEMDRLAPVKLMIDAGADGWFLGRGNLLFTLTPSTGFGLETKLQIFNAADPNKWPFMDESLNNKLQFHVRGPGDRPPYRISISLPRNGFFGLNYSPHKSIGLLAGFLRTPDADGNKRYVDLYEPNRFFKIELVRR